MSLSHSGFLLPAIWDKGEDSQGHGQRVQGRALNILHVLNLDPPPIDSGSGAPMYVLDLAQLVPVGVCSVYEITGTEHILK